MIQRSRERLKKVRKKISNLFQPFGPLGTVQDLIMKRNLYCFLEDTWVEGMKRFYVEPESIFLALESESISLFHVFALELESNYKALLFHSTYY